MDFQAYPSIPRLCADHARLRATVVHSRSLLEQLFQAVVNEAWSTAISVIKAISESPSESLPLSLARRARVLVAAIQNPKAAGPTYADLCALLLECRGVLLAQEFQTAFAEPIHRSDLAA